MLKSDIGIQDPLSGRRVDLPVRRFGSHWPVPSLIDVRPEERRLTGTAFFVLFGALAAHTLLETGRDALFLTRLPASELPWMYLALGALALLATRAKKRMLVEGRAFPLLLGACAAGTFLFWFAGSGPWALRALYVWTGLVATLASVATWLLLGRIYTMAQARRLYGAIGLGGLLGAIAGAVVARAISEWLDARHLLAASAATLALTALWPARLLAAASGRLPPDAPRESAVAHPTVIGRHPYLNRVAGLVLVSSVAVTLADYVFKSTVAASVESARLASFFASFNLGLSAAALAAQVLLAGWLMRVLGVGRALAVLPPLLTLGAAGVAAGAGLAGAVLLKAADGTLRPSLNKMGLELLFVPLPDVLRSAARPAIDVLGHRGGQALGSALILGAAAWGGGTEVVAAAAAVAGVVWTAAALALRPHYLDVFRTAVREGTLQDGAPLPPLDLNCLKALLAALNSGDDGEVLAALELLAGHARERVVPALLLHHPSKVVVLRTFELLSQTRRTDWIPIADRLLGSRDPDIRAAALRARTTAQPDERSLRAAAEDPSPLVRATALAGLVGSGWESDDAWRGLWELAGAPSPATRAALAQAIERQPSLGFEGLLLQLGRSGDERVIPHVARAMASVRSSAFLPTLLGWLSVREFRGAAREALRAHGDDALRALDAALGDERLPLRVREHVPRTISLFPPGEAARLLQGHLVAQRNGRVHYKVLRGLGRIATDHPEVRLDQALVRQAAARAIADAVEVVRARVRLVQGARRAPSRATPAHLLLVSLLRDKETHVIESFFRLLQLRFRKEDVRSIHRGLRNANARVRAASRELLENLLEEPLRSTVMALVDDLPDEERLARTAHRVRMGEHDYEGLLKHIAAVGDVSLRSLAAFHAAELGWDAAPVGGFLGDTPVHWGNAAPSRAALHARAAAE